MHDVKRRTYETDRKWTDQFIPDIKRILGIHLFQESSVEVDMKQATDLVILNAKNYKIACRIRQFEYYEKYHGEFTLRKFRDSGAKTEFEKILEGFGDLLFYGFGSNIGSTILYWSLIDLHAFRFHWQHSQHQMQHGEKSNGDGTRFEWFKIASFPKEPAILIASSSEVLEEVHPQPPIKTPDSKLTYEGIEALLDKKLGKKFGFFYKAMEQLIEKIINDTKNI